MDPRDVYAVVRLDSFRNFTPRPENVSIRKVHQSLSDAELEVRQLNGTAPTGTVYFIQRTTVAPGTPRAPQPRPQPIQAAAPALAPAPKSRRARAEKKAQNKKKKKGRRR
ncbi:MAG TPA: hypothetical protein VGR46_03260 [Candidatus Limnocylindria bacterium]|nr:hypothetical protein [Candidatus Limnocylindria bacterium]